MHQQVASSGHRGQAIRLRPSTSKHSLHDDCPPAASHEGFQSESVCFKSKGHRRCHPRGVLKCQRQGTPQVVLCTCRKPAFCALHGWRVCCVTGEEGMLCKRCLCRGNVTAVLAFTMPAMKRVDVFLNRLNNFTASLGL